MSDSAATASTTQESPFDHAYSEASSLTMATLTPGVEYTLVRNRDNSDAGRAVAFFDDREDALRYIARLEAAHAAGELGNVAHPQPSSLDVSLYTVFRHE